MTNRLAAALAELEEARSTERAVRTLVAETQGGRLGVARRRVSPALRLQSCRAARRHEATGAGRRERRRLRPGRGVILDPDGPLAAHLAALREVRAAGNQALQLVTDVGRRHS